MDHSLEIHNSPWWGRQAYSLARVYMCGQITGASVSEARYGWRQQVHKALSPLGVECISPMRGRFEQEDGPELSPLGIPSSVTHNAKSLTHRDRFDVFRADLLFCNLLGMNRVSQGSMIEFGWADARRIPILCCIEPDGSNPHEHAMLQELVSWRCESLQEGIEVTTNILSAGL